MPKITPNKSDQKVNTKNQPVNENEGIFVNAIPSKDFMKQIRAIQRSTAEHDVVLRNAAKSYLNNLHCV